MKNFIILFLLIFLSACSMEMTEPQNELEAELSTRASCEHIGGFLWGSTCRWCGHKLEKEEEEDDSKDEKEPPSDDRDENDLFYLSSDNFSLISTYYINSGKYYPAIYCDYRDHIKTLRLESLFPVFHEITEMPDGYPWFRIIEETMEHQSNWYFYTIKFEIDANETRETRKIDGTFRFDMDYHHKPGCILYYKMIQEPDDEEEDGE